MARVDCCMLIILAQLYLTFHSQKYLNMDDIYIYIMTYIMDDIYISSYIYMTILCLMQARGLREGFPVDCPADLGH